jgi:hypothetical protein
MRLPDFKFDGNTRAEIKARENQYNSWIENVSLENFIKIGVSGQGDPVYLPAILDSIEVSGSLLVDEAGSEGKSGSVKIISGWADCDVAVNLILIDIPLENGRELTPNVTRFDCLKEITQVFKRLDGNRPCVYTLQHPHISAWGAREFIFNSLKSSESRGKRTINCTLEFDEFDSAIGKSQDRQLGAASDTAVVTSENPVVPDTTRRGLGELEARYAKQ